MRADIMFENQIQVSLGLTVYDNIIKHSTQHNVVHAKNFMMKVYAFIDLMWQQGQGTPILPFLTCYRECYK